jgi:hypothetical protein
MRKGSELGGHPDSSENLKPYNDLNMNSDSNAENSYMTDYDYQKIGLDKYTNNKLPRGSDNHLENTIEIRAKVLRCDIKNISTALKSLNALKEVEFYEQNGPGETSKQTRKNMYAMGLNPDDDVYAIGNKTRLKNKFKERFSNELTEISMQAKRKKMHMNNRIEKGCPISAMQKASLMERERRGMLGGGEFGSGKIAKKRNMVI